MKPAIIFDLDGTLWDATYAFKTVYDIKCKRENVEIIYDHKDFCEIMGSTPEMVIEKMHRDSNWSKEECIKFFKPFYLETLEYIKKNGCTLYPKEEETLSILSKQYDLYIVSNGSKGYVEMYFSTSKLDKYFKGYLQSGDTNLTKADNIKKLLNDYQIDKAIYVGDTYLDYLECKKANIDIIYASYGFGKMTDYKYKLNKISDLLDIKDKLFN